MSPLFGGGGRRDDGERSADDRERARLDREARRARREGRPEPTMPPPLEEPPPPPGVDPVWEREPEPEPVLPEPEPVPEPIAYEQPEAPADPPTYDVAAREPEVAEPAPEVVPEPDPEPGPHPESEPVVEPEPAEETGDYTYEHPVPSRVDPVDEPRVRRAAAPIEPEPIPEPEPEPEPSPEPEPEYDPQATQAFSALPEAVEPEPGPEPVDPEPEPEVLEPAAIERDEHQGDEVWTDDVPAVRVLGREDPAGVKRIQGSAVISAAGAEGLPRAGAGGPPRKRRRWGRRLLLLVPLLVIAAVLVVLNLIYQPFAGEGSGQVVVTVPQGSTANEVGTLLADKGVVASSFFFGVRSRITGDRSNLRAGTYTFQKGMPYDAVLTRLTTVPTAAPTIDVTIPEGRSRRETRPIVVTAGVKGSYLTASKTSSELSPRDYGAPRSTRTLEGFLFPATYELRRGATSKTLVTEQLQAFRRTLRGISMTKARARGLSRFDVVIIASMIEREATLASERRTISAVIYNRLKQDIPLGIDATTRFETNNWTKPLVESVLQKDTPYNTRLNLGLPPGPIGSPGLASLKAAADPSSSKALYYVVKPGGKGAHAFSETDAQFQRDVAAYNRARAANGGKDPSGG